MPTYEYACKACGHTFEIVQSFSEDALTTCPACEQEQLRKVYNAAGIILKGDGWHSKDYAATSTKTGTTTADDTSGSSDGGATDASDATTSSGSSTSGGDSATPAAS